MKISQSRWLGLPALIAAVMAVTAPATAQQDPVIAIDILLVPDQTMIRHASDANARLRKVSEGLRVGHDA